MSIRVLSTQFCLMHLSYAGSLRILVMNALPAVTPSHIGWNISMMSCYLPSLALYVIGCYLDVCVGCYDCNEDCISVGKHVIGRYLAGFSILSSLGFMKMSWLLGSEFRLFSRVLG